MENKEFEDKLIKRFDTLISLVLDVALSEKPALISGKIQRLLDLGLTPAEIGEILGKPTNYVTAVMHSKKKKVKKKG